MGTERSLFRTQLEWIIWTPLHLEPNCEETAEGVSEIRNNVKASERSEHKYENVAESSHLPSDQHRSHTVPLAISINQDLGI